MILYCAVRRRQLISKCIPWKCCSPCLSHRFQLLCMLSVKGEGRGSVSVWVSISGSMCVCVGGVWRGVSVCVCVGHFICISLFLIQYIMRALLCAFSLIPLSFSPAHSFFLSSSYSTLYFCFSPSSLCPPTHTLHLFLSLPPTSLSLSLSLSNSL